MKGMTYLKNNKGFALVAALSAMLLLLALSGAAMTMSQLGSFTVASEKKYQLATWAAEYGLNVGVSATSGSCPASASGSAGSASYSYFSVTGGSYCFIHSTGSFGGASVVRTAVVPAGGSYWSAVSTYGGTFNVGGSSAIVGCDTADTSACPNMAPGITNFSGSSLTGGYSANEPGSCPNNPNDVQGGPPVQNLPEADNDITDKYFNSDSESDVVADLASKYAINLPALTIPGTAGTDYCSVTITSIMPYGDNDKNVFNPALAGIFAFMLLILFMLRKFNVRRLGYANIIVLFLSVALMLIFSSSFVNSMSGGPTITTTPSGCVGKTKIHISGSGSSISTTDLTSAITGGLGNKTIVSEGTVTVDSAITDANIFANTLTVDLPANTDVNGGTFYSKMYGTIDGGSNADFGTSANPILFISDDGGSGTTFKMGGNGTFSMAGMLFTMADTVEMTGNGNWSLHGSFVSNTAITDNTRGNWSIKFNKSVLDTLYSDLGGFIKQPQCSGNKGTYINNTKVTVY